MSARKYQIPLFFGAVFLMAAAGGVHDSIFNNFLSDTFNLSARARGWLELPREMPGFLVVLMTGILCALSLTRLAVVSVLTMAAGLVGIAFVGTRFLPMVGMMMVASAGMHLLHPVGASIVIGLSDETNRGWRMGLMGTMGTIGMAAGAGLIWLFLDRDHPAYRVGFLAAAGIVGAAAIFYGLMHLPHLHQERRSRLVVRRKYSLYYALELIFGARKQIFLTFGPWVLVRVYDLPATEIAKLFMIASVIGIAFKPLAGLAMDKFGERTILVADGLALAVVCAGYGYAKDLAPNAETARLIACGCFVVDDLLFALGNARSIYVSRLTRSSQELTSTLAMGVSINHIVSMTIPIAAGAVWAFFGYQRLFLVAAVFAVCIAAISTLVPGKKRSVALGAPAIGAGGQEDAVGAD